MRPAILSLLLVAFTAPAVCQTIDNETVHLTRGIPDIYSGHGCSVAVDGEWLAVGDFSAYRASSPGVREGSVDVYKRTDAGWVLHQRLFSPVPQHGGMFGRRVALDSQGGQLLVGVPQWSDSQGDSGSEYFVSGRAYLFDLSGEQWAHSLTLRPLIPNSPDHSGQNAGTFRHQRFGYAVEVEGDRMAIGAPQAATISPSVAPVVVSGLTYTYRKVGGQWTIDQIIEPPQIEWGFRWNFFGTRLDLDSDRLVVSGYLGTEGKVFLFERSSAGWVLEADFSSPLPGAGFVSREFGYSLSLDGDRLAVGTPSWDCSNAVCPSVVAIFEKQGQNWLQTQVLDEINLEPGNEHGRFGTDLKLKGDSLLVSLPGQNHLGTPRGEARHYKHLPGQGFQLQTIYRHRSNPLSANSLLGMEVDADFENGMLIAGDPNYHYAEPLSPNGNGSAFGAVLVFDLPLGQELTCPGSPNTFGAAGHLSVLGNLQVSESRLTLHASQLPPGKLALFLYGQSGMPYNIQSGGQLCINGGIYRMLPAGLIGEWGERILDVDFTLPREAQNLMPGTTWAFQVWHRDLVPGLPSFTGTTNAVEVLLQ